MEPMWARIEEELRAVGLEAATVNGELEADLTKKLGIVSLPHILFVIDGRSWHFKV